MCTDTQRKTGNWDCPGHIPYFSGKENPMDPVFPPAGAGSFLVPLISHDRLDRAICARQLWPDCNQHERLATRQILVATSSVSRVAFMCSTRRKQLEKSHCLRVHGSIGVRVCLWPTAVLTPISGAQSSRRDGLDLLTLVPAVLLCQLIHPPSRHLFTGPRMTIAGMILSVTFQTF
jgi:hypothetical protein